MSFTPYDRPVRAAFVGLGRIYDLNMRAYLDNPDVEVVALVDPERGASGPTPGGLARGPHLRLGRRAGRQRPRGRRRRSAAADPPPRRRRDRAARLRLARQPAKADVQRPGRARRRMLDAARANDRMLRVMENYIFYEPLRRLKETVESGDLGEVSGYHMKMVGSGRGGWDVPAEQLPMAVPADAERARDPRLRRRMAQAGHRALALRPDQRGAGLGGEHRGVPDDRDGRPDHHRLGARERHPRRVGHHPGARHVPALRLLHQRRAVGGHRAHGVTPG